MPEKTLSATPVQILVLGRGFVGSYVEQLCRSKGIPSACTTRDGREGTIRWSLPDDTERTEPPNSPTTPTIIVPCDMLPWAKTVLITFPLPYPAAVTAFVHSYEATHPFSKTLDVRRNDRISPTTTTFDGVFHQSDQPDVDTNKPVESRKYILLSSTQPYTLPKSTRLSPLDETYTRLPSEREFLSIATVHTSVLHLAGLWGGQRQPRNWVKRFLSLEKVKAKVLNRQLHLIHGMDVAVAVVCGIHPLDSTRFPPDQRWILSDGRVYDWLKLFKVYGGGFEDHGDERTELARILLKLRDRDDECQTVLSKDIPLDEIPVGAERIGLARRLDPDEFWDTVNLQPNHFLKITTDPVNENEETVPPTKSPPYVSSCYGLESSP